MQIKHKDTGAVLFEENCATTRECAEAAVRARANLSGANLSGADLGRAYLREANLSGADLGRAYLREANLRGAYLGRAYLREANLSGAYLRGAYLGRAYLREANLSGAYLRGAYLREANLRGADLGRAYLREANLSEAKLPDFWLCPEEGAFIAWKKLMNGAIAKLEIPAEAKRVCSPVGRKMRAEYARTMAIWNCNGARVKSGTGLHDGKTKYIVGKITRPDKFDDDIRVECTHGIHFFINRKEAEDYR